jgi:hypothetical protein
VLIGATAMGFHGLVRATEAVDLFIRATAENVERLRQALGSVYVGDPHIDEIHAWDLLGEYPAVRYYPPNADLFFDVMTRLGEAASFDTVEAEVREFEGVRVSVATPRALYRMKKGTVATPGSTGRGRTSRQIQPGRRGLGHRVCLSGSSDRRKR